MFSSDDEEFISGQEFLTDFIANMYCRIYIPKSEIIRFGETFPELYMIHKGIVIVQVKGLSKEGIIVRLPSNSYFGDYQILFELKSQLIYRSGDNDHTYTMCLKKSKLKELLDDYPEAKKYYEKRAWERRIEFRRVSLSHLNDI